MPGMSAQNSSTGTDTDSNTHRSNGRGGASANEDRTWTANKKAVSLSGSNLTRSGSVKNLISRFSGEGPHTPTGSQASSATFRVKGHETSEDETVVKKSQSLNSDPSGVIEKKSEQMDVVITHVPAQYSSSNGEGQLIKPPSEDEPGTPRIRPNPKYQLYLGTNGSGAGGGPVSDSSLPANGNLSRLSSSIRGSMESLSSREWDSMSDKMGGFDSPPRVFNSPYSTLSLDYNSSNRSTADFKSQEVMSPSFGDINLFGLNRSVSPVHSPVLSHRSRISNYDSLTRRRDVSVNQMSLRSNQPNKRDFIQDLTIQLEECRRRNQFLEAESLELEKERTQIRFEMRGLLVNNEDLLRTNTQMQGESNRLRDRIVELESNNNVLQERFRQMEMELKEAREVMVEANTQEYAFNFLQQTLKNKIHDTEDALEKQTQHAQTVSEKLWIAERNLEEIDLERETKSKRVLELSSTVSRLETELSDALQSSNQARAELNLQQKLRADVQLRVEELEESVLEKDQELLRLTQIVSRLQGEVTDKLSDREQTLEEEIQLRERAQLQCRQAERTVEDLRMELQTLNQSRDELAKHLKLAQEKIIDLESDLEELQENEQRWTSKHRRAVDQSEQLQMKLIQEKDVSEQMECEKAFLERQLRDLRSEMDELHNNRVEVDSITKAEMKTRELENSLRTEERNKLTMANNITKLEKKLHELMEQMEEEQKISTEQRELMTQRIRSLKRQLNEAEEEASRRDVQHRHTQRELMEEREASSRLQRQLIEQQLTVKRKESRQTLENLKFVLNEDEDEEHEKEEQEKEVMKEEKEEESKLHEEQNESKPSEKLVTQV